GAARFPGRPGASPCPASPAVNYNRGIFLLPAAVPGQGESIERLGKSRRAVPRRLFAGGGTLDVILAESLANSHGRPGKRAAFERCQSAAWRGIGKTTRTGKQ